MKRIIQMSMLLCVCLLHMNAQSQVPEAPEPPKSLKNSFFLEGLGNGLLYSLNYDHLFSIKKHPELGVGARIGVSHFGAFGLFGSSGMTTLPAEAYFSYGRKNCLELGPGYTTMFEGEYHEGLPTVRLGYRHRGSGGIMLGAGVTGFIEAYGMWVLPQLSVGVSF
jgi:hypothetical protein